MVVVDLIVTIARAFSCSFAEKAVVRLSSFKTSDIAIGSLNLGHPYMICGYMFQLVLHVGQTAKLGQGQ